LTGSKSWQPDDSNFVFLINKINRVRRFYFARRAKCNFPVTTKLFLAGAEVHRSFVSDSTDRFLIPIYDRHLSLTCIYKIILYPAYLSFVFNFTTHMLPTQCFAILCHVINALYLMLIPPTTHIYGKLIRKRIKIILFRFLFGSLYLLQEALLSHGTINI